MKLLSSFILILVFGQLNAQVDSLGCTGALGDAKYSILAIDDFQEVNGDCWVLMEGQNISSSRLGAYGYSEIPDARGYFIRAHDTHDHDDPDRVDQDRSTTLPVGSIQMDQFKSHNHNLGAHGLMRTYTLNSSATGGFDNTITEPNIRDLPLQMPNRGGTETRPKNISLYLYIRIN